MRLLNRENELHTTRCLLVEPSRGVRTIRMDCERASLCVPLSEVLEDVESLLAAWIFDLWVEQRARKG